MPRGTGASGGSPSPSWPRGRSPRPSSRSTNRGSHCIDRPVLDRAGVTMRILFASSLALAVSALAPSHAVECRNPVACLQLSKDAAGNLKARIALAQMSAGGVLLIEKIEPGPPESLVVEWRDVSCGADRELM